MWLVFALLAAFFFAVVHVLDSYCVGEIFEKPWMGVITSSIASLVVFQLIPFVGPFVDWTFPPIQIVILAFLAGVLIQISQALYFQALEYSEAGIVAAYWNLIPVLLPLLTFAIYGRFFSLYEYAGIAILTLASIAMCLVDGETKTRWRSFLLMICACIMQVGVYLLEEIVFAETPFFLGFLIITCGLIFAGLVPLLFKNIRIVMVRNIKTIITMLRFFIIIEIANLAALFFAQRGIATGKPSLVAAAETTMSAYAFLLSLLFLFFFPKLGDKQVWHKLHYKIMLVLVMCFGVWMVS
ncbi:EamA family transporter [Candidatus Peribacteria bacterium]|nr:MAG: EamA family transporter [Candidatus Peribacteria bacterium]